MRQFHKGQRLIKLCEKKTCTEQQTLSRHTRKRLNLLDEIERCKAEMQTLEQILVAQQLHDVSSTKAEIYALRRKQAIILHQRQQLKLEHTMRLENLRDVDIEIEQCHRQLAYLKRREIKFTKWTSTTKKEWLSQKETVSDNEIQERASWHQ